MCLFTVTGGEITGYYRFLKAFYRLADIPTVCQERIDKILEFEHPTWLDDKIIVIKGSAEKHETEVKEAMKKLEETGDRPNSKNCDFFKKRSRVDRTQNRPKRITTLRRQIGSYNKKRNTKKQKEIKDLESDTILSKDIEKRSAQTDILRKLLKKVDMDR